MNVYDFDKTLFPSDSPVKFWSYCKKKYPKIWKHFPGGVTKMILYKFKMFTWTEVMEKVFEFLKYLPDPLAEVEAFWNENESKIYSWYKDVQKENDVIITATPRFLIEPIAKRLGIKNLIATELDLKTYKVNGIDCTGIEKVRRFKEIYGNIEIDNFYSDSFSDTPLAEISKNAYMVHKGGKITPWNFQSKKGKKKNRLKTKEYIASMNKYEKKRTKLERKMRKLELKQLILDEKQLELENAQKTTD